MFAMLGLLYCATLQAIVGAPQLLVFEPGDRALSLVPALEMLDPEEVALTVDDAAAPELANNYEPLGTTDVHLGYTAEAYWFRFSLLANEPLPPLALDISNSQLLSVKLYSPTAGGQFTEQSVGVAEPFSTRPLLSLNPLFPLHLEVGLPQTYYLRVEHYGALRFNASIRRADVAREAATLRISLNFLLAGALLGLAIFNGCIYAGLRQTAYLWLCLMLIAAAMNQLTFSGAANMLLWQNPSEWGNHALTLTGIICQGLGVGFSISFLQSWKYTPRLAWFSVAFVIVGTGVGLLTLAGQPMVFYGMIGYVLLGPAVIGTLAIQAGRKAAVPVGLFLLTWGVVLVGEIFFCMVYLDLLRDNAFTANFMHVSVLGASLVWSFSLTRQIKDKARRQQEILELMVTERTIELKTALNEVKTLKGLLPVCSNCKKIRDDAGAWHGMEAYVSKHTGADFSHGICPDCVTELYPEYDRRGKG